MIMRENLYFNMALKECECKRNRGCKPETEEKYRPALELYTATDLSIAEICRQCGVSLSGFSRYIGTYHRHLLLARNGIKCSPEEAGDIKMDQRRGQHPETHAKYKEAIAACDSMDYIEYNVSQIAREFGLSGTNLGRQLRTHYPEVLEFREGHGNGWGWMTACRAARARGARNSMPKRWGCCKLTVMSRCRKPPSGAMFPTPDWSNT